MRRLAVKRHGGGRPARKARELGAPFVGGDRRDFNLELAAVNDFFEAMHVHDNVEMGCAVSATARCSLAWQRRQSSERTIEGASTECSPTDLSDEPYEKKLWCRNFNNGSTVLPHVFHTAGGYEVSMTLDDRAREQ